MQNILLYSTMLHSIELLQQTWWAIYTHMYTHVCTHAHAYAYITLVILTPQTQSDLLFGNLNNFSREAAKLVSKICFGKK